MIARDAAPEDAGLPGHIPALDGLRGVAILLVLLVHFYVAWGRPAGEGIVDRGVTVVASGGWIGVDLFFVLSGFLITRILLDAKEQGGAYFGSFYARRVLRIFPAYYVYLLLLFVLLPLVPALRDDPGLNNLSEVQAWYWLYAQNIYGSLHPLTNFGSFQNGHLWSLAVEEQFYLVWPFAVWLLTRRGLLTLGGVMIVAALVIRLALHEHWLPWGDNAIGAHTLMPARMDALAVGAVIAVIVRGPADIRARQRTITWLAVVFALAFSAIYVTGDGGIYRWSDQLVSTVGLSLLALSFGCLLMLALSSTPIALVAFLGASPLLRAFGKYSYAIYIFHFQWAVVLVEMLPGDGSAPTVFGAEWPARMGLVLLGTVTSLAIGWLTWQLLEQPILRLKRHFPYGRPRDPDRSTVDVAQPEPEVPLAT